MSHSSTTASSACLTILTLLSSSCGEDAGPPSRIEDLAIAEERTFPGLTAPVEVVTDGRGIPHLYAASLTDAAAVQGYLMARDRIGQMEFLRRAVSGRLAELA